MKLKNKKGFTLAEVLIALSIIGFVAVLTIPGILQSADARQKITGIKKAYYTLNNAYLVEFVRKAGPQTNDDAQMKRLFDALINNMDVKTFMNVSNINSTTNNGNYGSIVNSIPTGNYNKYWIVAEDGIAYRIIKSAANCASKETINGKASDTQAISSTCFVIVVDYDASKGENKFITTLPADLKTIIGDSVRFYVGSDGITPGGLESTIAGIITNLSD